MRDRLETKSASRKHRRPFLQSSLSSEPRSPTSAEKNQHPSLRPSDRSAVSPLQPELTATARARDPHLVHARLSVVQKWRVCRCCRYCKCFVPPELTPHNLRMLQGFGYAMHTGCCGQLPIHSCPRPAHMVDASTSGQEDPTVQLETTTSHPQRSLRRHHMIAFCKPCVASLEVQSADDSETPNSLPQTSFATPSHNQSRASS